MSIGQGITVVPFVGAGTVVATTQTFSAGSTLVLLLGDGAGTSAGESVTGTGCTFAQDSNSPIADTGDAWQMWVYVAYNITGGSTTITYTAAHTNTPVMGVVELTGAATSAAIEVSAASPNNASANPDLQVTTISANDYAVAFIIDGRGADTISVAGSGGPTWTRVGGIPAAIGNLAYCMATAPVPSASTATGPAWQGVASGRTNALWTGAFKGAGGGVAPPLIYSKRSVITLDTTIFY